MNALRLACEIIGALVLLGWLVVIVAVAMVAAVARIERARKWRWISVMDDRVRPEHMAQGGWCANRDLRHLERRIGRRDPSHVQPDTLERLLGPTVEEP